MKKASNHHKMRLSGLEALCRVLRCKLGDIIDYATTEQAYFMKSMCDKIIKCNSRFSIVGVSMNADRRRSFWTGIACGLLGAFAFPMGIVFITALIDPHSYTGDLTWTTVPGFIGGFIIYYCIGENTDEPAAQNGNATPTRQEATNQEERRIEKSPDLRPAEHPAGTADNNPPTKASACNVLEQIDVYLDSKNADAIARVMQNPILLQPNQQGQAARLYVKAVDRIGLIGVGSIMHSAFGGTPDYTEAQEKVIESILPYLARSGLNPNIQLDGKPLIHCVIEASNGSDAEEATTSLINIGANVNCVNQEGLSALGAHLAHGMVSDNYRFEPYLSHGAKLNSEDRVNEKIYATIFENGLDNVFDMISDSDLRSLIDNSEYRDGVWMLLRTIQGNYVQSSDPVFLENRRMQYEQNTGYLTIAKRLLEFGVKPNKSIEPGRVPTAIELAMYLGRNQIVDLMLPYAR